MAKSLKQSQCEDKYVDIHGRELSAVAVGENEVAISLSDLKQTGFCIYQKSQFAHLSSNHELLDHDFDNHMLEAAKTYMLQNKVSFSQEEILKSIADCKKTVQGVKEVPADDFFKNRSVETNSDADIIIRVINTSDLNSASSGTKKKSPNVKQLVSPKNLNFGKEAQCSTPKTYYERTLIDFKKGPAAEKVTQAVRPFIPPEKVKLEKETAQVFAQPSKNAENVCTENQQQRSRDNNMLYLPPEEFDVIVTHIDKPNCVWVRYKDSQDALSMIHLKVNEEAKFQKKAERPFAFDQVYMAPEEGSWFRCKIVTYKPYKPLIVAFLDYGNVCEVPEIRYISPELSQLPLLAMRITFRPLEYEPHLEDEIRIKRFAQNQDGTYFVNVLKVLTRSGVDEERKFFKRPPNLCSLENGQKVVVIHAANCVLYLRTRECFQKLKQIEDVVDTYITKAKSVGNVKVHELVLCHSKEIDRFCRGVVISIAQNIAEVELLDYFGRMKTNVGELKTISEELANIPCSYYSGGKLNGFEDVNSDEVLSALIQEHIKKRTKFSTSLGFDNELDLYDGSQLLSEQIQAQKKAKAVPNRLLLKNIEPIKPEFCLRWGAPFATIRRSGSTCQYRISWLKITNYTAPLKSYLCGTYKNQNDLTLIQTDVLQEYIDYVIKPEIKDGEPCTPIVGEVCYCRYKEDWYRCVVTRILNTEFQVLLIDFGNVAFIKSADFRKADEHITKAPALGLPCRLTVPNLPNLEEVLRNLIIEGEIYNVDIKCVNDGKYLVEIPSVYQQIMKRT